MSLQKNEAFSLFSRKALIMRFLSLIGLASLLTGQLQAFAPPTTITVNTPTPGVRVRLVCLTRQIIPITGNTARTSNGKNQAFFDLNRLYSTKLPSNDVWNLQYWNGRTWVTWRDPWGNTRIEMNIGMRRSLVILSI